MASHPFMACVSSLLFLCAQPLPVHGQAPAQSEKSQVPASKAAPSKQSSSPKQPSAEEELQQAISNSGNDRAALVRNLESFLNKYPDYPNRTSIYRALVEASLQLQDNARAADYAERMVALNPNDISILLLAVELLEGQRRAEGSRCRLDSKQPYARHNRRRVRCPATGDWLPPGHGK